MFHHEAGKQVLWLWALMRLAFRRAVAIARPPFSPDIKNRCHEEKGISMTQLDVQLNEYDATNLSSRLASLSAREIVEWASHSYGDGLVVSTSFGIQSAVMLHLATQVRPNIPVVWIDTGYLPAETYRFADSLTTRLRLNLQVYQSSISPARMETVHGKLWESDDLNDLNLYDRIRKVEPMNRALIQHNATAWLTGLRRDQTDFRKTLSHLTIDRGRSKVQPILDWSSKDVFEYLSAHDLPYHPLFEDGYVSVGDWHSSRPLTADDADARDTRFGGRKQECGIHLPENTAENLAAFAA